MGYLLGGKNHPVHRGWQFAPFSMELSGRENQVMVDNGGYLASHVIPEGLFFDLEFP